MPRDSAQACLDYCHSVIELHRVFADVFEHMRWLTASSGYHRDQTEREPVVDPAHSTKVVNVQAVSSLCLDRRSCEWQTDRWDETALEIPPVWENALLHDKLAQCSNIACEKKWFPTSCTTYLDSESWWGLPIARPSVPLLRVPFESPPPVVRTCSDLILSGHTLR